MRRRIVVGAGTALAGALAAGLVGSGGSDVSLAKHGYGPPETVTRTETVSRTETVTRTETNTETVTNTQTVTVPAPPPEARGVVISASVRRAVRRGRFRVICRISGGVGVLRCGVSASALVRGRRRTVGTGSRTLVNGVANVPVRLNRVGRRALRGRLQVSLVVSPVPAQAGATPLRTTATLVRAR